MIVFSCPRYEQTLPIGNDGRVVSRCLPRNLLITIPGTLIYSQNVDLVIAPSPPGKIQRLAQGGDRGRGRAGLYRYVQFRAAIEYSEPFSSSLCCVNFQGVDCLGELPGAPRAAAQLAEDPPVLELGVRALAG